VPEEIMVRMGELAVTSEDGSVLTVLGLGSCIAICAYDPLTGTAGLAHVVLPSAVGKADGCPAKSADVAVPNLVEAMLNAGAAKHRLKVAITGGAQLFSFKGADNIDVGNRNTAAVKSGLAGIGITPLAEETGGSTGRTVKLMVATGEVLVRQAGKPDRLLAELGGRALRRAA
jgi:chemotaxis protein CheD